MSDRQHTRLYLLTHADTDAVVFARVLKQMPAEFRGSAVLPLQHIKTAEQLSSLVAQADEGTIVVCRLLGNIAEVPGLSDAMKALASRRCHLIVLSGTGERKPEHEALSTVPSKLVDTVWLYLTFGGTGNVENLLYYLAKELFPAADQYSCKPPRPVPDQGIYHPRLGAGSGLKDWQAIAKADRPTVGINFYKAHWLSANTDFIDRLVECLEKRGMNALPVFTASGRAVGDEMPPSYSLFLDENGKRIVDAIINTTSFSMGELNTAALERLNVPIVQAICTSMTQEQWWTSTRGLNALDTAMNIAMPEFDGRIVTVPISAKTADLNCMESEDAALYTPLEERADRVSGIVEKLVALRTKPNTDKRIAFVFTNASSKASQIGNAVGLDAPQSLVRLLEAMQVAGYGVELPESADALIHELIDRCSYDQTYLTESQCDRAIGAIPAALYEKWFDKLPQACREKMVAQWGSAPGDAYVHNNKLLIAGIELGNAVVILQPPRGYGMDPNAIYHQPDLPPTHHYFAVYNWLAEVWQADAIVHVGKHGTLEWLPGKGVGLSALCFPDAFLRDMPLVYPFIINDPGEGSQAKRRSHAVIVDHLPPPLTTADTYGVLGELTELVDEYYRCEALDPAKLPLLRQQIWELIKEANLDEDLKYIVEHDHDDDDHDHNHDHHRDHDHEHEHHHAHDDDEDHDHEWDETLSDEGVPVSLTEMDSVKVSHLVQEIDGYLCELGLAQIRDGLHILGNAPSGSSLVDTLACLTRLPNETAPGLHAAIAKSFELNIDELLDNKGGKASASAKLDALAKAARHTVITHADALEACEAISKRLFAYLEASAFSPAAIPSALASIVSLPAEETRDIESALNYACAVLIPKLRKTTAEIDNTLRALNAAYIPPGPSGAPSRGMAHILPTGRNFYSVDPRSVPSVSAWNVGQQLAQEVIDRFLRDSGRYPESICISVWGTSAMRTHGDDVAEILALLGVRPRWQHGSPRIAGLEVIPLGELKRPRIDVTTRISGLFRDAFPHLIALIDEAVNLVINRDEPLDMNFVRKHYLEERALLEKDGLTSRQADLRSRYRVFGSKPGTYGAGILSLIQEQNWTDEQDIAEVYLNWGSFAYTAGESGTAAKEDLCQRLKIVDVAVHNQDNREHDIFDSDDYFQFHGGLIATVRALSGKAPKSYFGDSHDPSRSKVRDLREETLRVFRSRVVNPKWIESIKQHGYKGGLELSATVDYLFGYDATAEVMQDWMYEQVAQTYALDPAMQEFLHQSNPWALKAMSERLLEAARRDMWEKPSPETLQALKETLLQSESALERRSGTRMEEPV